MSRAIYLRGWAGVLPENGFYPVAFVGQTVASLHRGSLLPGTIDQQAGSHGQSTLRREPLDELILVRRASQGDLSSWEPLVDLHREAIYRLEYVLLGDTVEAEEVAQDTFLRAWYSLRDFDEARPLRPWLLRIASGRPCVP